MTLDPNKQQDMPLFKEVLSKIFRRICKIGQTSTGVAAAKFHARLDIYKKQTVEAYTRNASRIGMYHTFY